MKIRTYISTNESLNFIKTQYIAEQFEKRVVKMNILELKLNRSKQTLKHYIHMQNNI
jgi:hypothetical protein